MAKFGRKCEKSGEIWEVKTIQYNKIQYNIIQYDTIWFIWLHMAKFGRKFEKSGEIWEVKNQYNTIQYNKNGQI